MILEKGGQLRLKDIAAIPPQQEVPPDFLQKMVFIEHIYHSAMKEAATRLEILDSEFASMYDHSPIHHMECRIKSMNSLVEKMKRKGIAVTADNVGKIQDMAGLRVICHYVEDIYYLKKLLVGQEGVRQIRERDYIRYPKANGYRSLHLILSIPFAIADGRMELPVEIQMRTMAMDMWASLEHELRYKSPRSLSEQDCSVLTGCASALAGIDETMQQLFQKVTASDIRKTMESTEGSESH